MKNAILLCSGGLDSVVTAHYVKKILKYNKLKILFFNYGQKALDKERKCAKKCTKEINAEFIEISLKWLGNISSSLINKSGKVNKLKKTDLRNTKEEGKNWYVPCRNTLFLMHALTLAESIFIKEKISSDIFVGFKNEGREHFPDTTPEFIKQINKLIQISCSGKFKVIAPLIKKDKEDIIHLGVRLGVKFQNTHSCYINSDEHCGYCLACQMRKQGFYWTEIKDPTKYLN